MEHKGDLHPQIVVEDEDGNIVAAYVIPEKAYIQVQEKQKIKAGAILAKMPREITGTQDITGGLPRVTELFEARRPKDPAVISEIDGVVELGEAKRDKMSIIVKSESGMEREHLVPRGKHLRVHRGAVVAAGDPLSEGPLVLQDILRIRGEEAVQQYLLREIQNVYRSQNQRIDDKHIEVIISQMMRRVRISESGASPFLPGTLADKFAFRETNARIAKEKGKPASATPVLMGITKAALHSESFLSAASFQETPKVLTEAALAAREDKLVGLKENVVMGRLIPAGTGLGLYRKALITRAALPETEQEGASKAPVKKEA
jgi:DNA-directed RNA polymerase subunit beta'